MALFRFARFVAAQRESYLWSTSSRMDRQEPADGGCYGVTNAVREHIARMQGKPQNVLRLSRRIVTGPWFVRLISIIP